MGLTPTMEIQQTPFVRELASSDRRTRDKALESLLLFLRSRPDLSLLDLLKVWKGLFFCFYHSDRPLNQQSLARHLSYTLVPALPKQTLQLFLRAFWITMSRDFHSLDRLRLDKYLFLVRCYVGVGFEIFLKRESSVTTTRLKVGSDGEQPEMKERKATKKRKRGEEDDGVKKAESQSDRGQEFSADACEDLETYLNMLEEGPLCPFNFPVHDEQQNHDKLSPCKHGGTEMPKGPDGLRYHLIDIWLDEIAKVATEIETISAPDSRKGGEKQREDVEETRTRLKEGIPIDLLLRPMQRLRKQSQMKTVRKKAGELFADERLVEWGVRRRESNEDEYEEHSDDGTEDEEWQGIDD